MLLGLTGLHISGGIASVSRCVARTLDGEVTDGRLQRADRVLLLEDPERAGRPPVRGEEFLARGNTARFAWQLWRSFRRHRHNLVFFDYVGLARSLALPLPGFPPRDSAIFVHGIELTRARGGSRARALQSARTVLANSEFTARRLRDDFPELTERIRVVPLCTDPERVAAWEADTRSEAPPREAAALIVGRMWVEERYKGHDELLAAWPSVLERVPGAQLWIVGSGRDKERLVLAARERGLADAVRFFGKVSDRELGQLYRRASVFTMPSREEGFGLVYAEAMWWGLPCIGSTADAAGQVIVDGETGILVPYGDAPALGRAVGEILANPERARRMGEASGRRARSEFSFPRFRRDLLSALELA